MLCRCQFSGMIARRLPSAESSATRYTGAADSSNAVSVPASSARSGTTSAPGSSSCSSGNGAVDMMGGSFRGVLRCVSIGCGPGRGTVLADWPPVRGLLRVVAVGSGGYGLAHFAFLLTVQPKARHDLPLG